MIQCSRKKVIDFIHNTWNKNCSSKCDIDTEYYNKVFDKIYALVIKNKKPTNTPFMFKIAGQSGSGKTTQILPAINSIINDNFIKIAIRDFVEYHPNYEEFLIENKDLIREKTNGYSLLLAFSIIEKLIKNKYNIIIEFTILDFNFEKYILKLAKENNYSIHIHILSINEKKSDLWIKKRKQTSDIEKGRVVFKSSSTFFYNVLPITLKKMINYKFFTKNDKMFLWSGFDLKPVFFGSIFKNNKFIKLFNKYRDIDFYDKNEKELLNNKIKWFKENYANYFTS